MCQFGIRGTVVLHVLDLFFNYGELLFLGLTSTSGGGGPLFLGFESDGRTQFFFFFFTGDAKSCGRACLKTANFNP